MRGSENIVKIRYGVQGNPRSGFIPYYICNGKYTCVPVRPQEERDQAIKTAKKSAQEEAEHYRGDWTIDIQEASDAT